MDQAAEVNTSSEYDTIINKDISCQSVEANTFRSLVRSLMYLCATRPDLMYFVSLVSRYMENPKQSHWEMGKRILRYVKGTLHQGIIYQKNNNFNVHRYCNYGGDSDEMMVKALVDIISNLIVHQICKLKKRPIS